MNDLPTLSRRHLLQGAALLSGVSLMASLAVRTAFAQQKASKEAMKYQDKPNGDMQCSKCLQFVAPGTCKVVEGNISPQGYCIAWVKK